jgi:hypothetical protein
VAVWHMRPSWMPDELSGPDHGLDRPKGGVAGPGRSTRRRHVSAKRDPDESPRCYAVTTEGQILVASLSNEISWLQLQPYEWADEQIGLVSSWGV